MESWWLVCLFVLRLRPVITLLILFIPLGFAWFIYHRDKAACCMQRPRCSSVTAVLGRLSGLSWHHPPLSPGRVSVSRGREFLLSLATGRAGLGRPDLAQHTFHQRGRVRVRPAGTGEETASRPEDWSRANNNKDCDQGPGWSVFPWHYWGSPSLPIRKVFILPFVHSKI